MNSVFPVRKCRFVLGTICFILIIKLLGIAVSVIDKKIRNTEFILNIRKMNKLWKNEKLKGKSFMESTIS